MRAVDACCTSERSTRDAVDDERQTIDVQAPFVRARVCVLARLRARWKRGKKRNE
jgi:hypothetical protein